MPTCLFCLCCPLLVESETDAVVSEAETEVLRDVTRAFLPPTPEKVQQYIYVIFRPSFSAFDWLNTPFNILNVHSPHL